MNSADHSLKRVLLAGLLLNALLVLPAWWREGLISLWLSPEAWAVPALVALLGRHAGAGLLRILLAAVLALVIIAGLFDGLLQSVLSRPLNAWLDILMLAAGFHLIDGSMGRFAAVLASVLVALAALAVGWLCWWLLSPQTQRRARTALAFLAAITVLLCLPWPGLKTLGVESQLVFQSRQQSGELRDTLATHQALEDARQDPEFRARALPGLAGRDVYLVLIESYGISALHQDRYAGHLLPLLEEWQDKLVDSGMSVASGQLEAPIRGGQSWLAQATVLSGLMLDNQWFYRRLLDTDIDLLTDDFSATGHSTLTVAPAIIMDWPEGKQLGFDSRYPADAMNYRGPRMGWATMPDQYTLYHFSERIRPAYPGPVFAQIALVSSHWPWTPQLQRLEDWSAIGHGEIFEPWRDQAESPLALWMSPKRLRENYAEKLAYSLAVTFDWARQYLPEDALLIVLGDHQPASIITGRAAPAEVPVHVISQDPALLVNFRQRAFADGLLPDDDGQAADMARLRDWLRADYSAPGQQTQRRQRDQHQDQHRAERLIQLDGQREGHQVGGHGQHEAQNQGAPPAAGQSERNPGRYEEQGKSRHGTQRHGAQDHGRNHQQAKADPVWPRRLTVGSVVIGEEPSYHQAPRQPGQQAQHQQQQHDRGHQVPDAAEVELAAQQAFDNHTALVSVGGQQQCCGPAEHDGHAIVIVVDPGQQPVDQGQQAGRQTGGQNDGYAQRQAQHTAGSGHLGQGKSGQPLIAHAQVRADQGERCGQDQSVEKRNPEQRIEQHHPVQGKTSIWRAQ